MTEKNNDKKPKKPSKGQRLHIRRIKQAAAKDPEIIRAINKRD